MYSTDIFYKLRFAFSHPNNGSFKSFLIYVFEIKSRFNSKALCLTGLVLACVSGRAGETRQLDALVSGAFSKGYARKFPFP